MTYISNSLLGAPTVPTGFNLPGGTITPEVAKNYLAATTGAAPRAASWLGGIGEEAAAAGGLGGRVAGFARGPFGPAAIGTLTSMGIKALPLGEGATSTQDVLANAAQVAGIGGTIGSFIAPGPGTLIGAGIGATVGGGATILSNIFGGDEGPSKNDLKSTLTTAANSYGLNPNDYLSNFDLMSKLGMTNPQTGKKLSDQDIAAQLAQQMMGDRATKIQTDTANAQATQQRQADQKFALALQAQAKDFFSPYTNNIVAAGQSQADVLSHLANQVPGAYKGVFEAQAANALANAQQMAGAYAAQTALMPAQLALAQTAQAQNQEIANQAKLFQYASQMQGRQGGGTGIQSLLGQGGQFNQQAGV